LACLQATIRIRAVPSPPKVRHQPGFVFVFSRRSEKNSRYGALKRLAVSKHHTGGDFQRSGRLLLCWYVASL